MTCIYTDYYYDHTSDSNQPNAGDSFPGQWIGVPMECYIDLHEPDADDPAPILSRKTVARKLVDCVKAGVLVVDGVLAVDTPDYKNPDTQEDTRSSERVLEVSDVCGVYSTGAVTHVESCSPFVLQIRAVYHEIS